jgi:flavin-dependent dehydrogenase
MEHFDVIVVGLGPAGLMACKTLAEKKVKVLGLDRKQEIGPPKRCAEGLGLNWFKRLSLKPDKEWAVQKVFGATLYAPSGKTVELKASKLQGFVLERKIFEKHLAIKAAKKGAKIIVKSDAIEAKRENNRVILTVNNGGEEKNYSCDLVIASDGIDSLIARQLGLNTTNKLVDVDSGYQYEMTNISGYDEKHIHFFFGTDVAPRGYCLTPDSEVFLKHSIKPISTIDSSEEVLTREGWAPVVAKSSRGYNGKIVRVTPFMLGQTAGLTEDHLVYVWNKGKGFLWKKARELKKSVRGSHRNGDYLVFPIPKEQQIEAIEVLKHYDKGIVEKGFVYPKGKNQFGSEFKYKHKIPQKLLLSEELLELMGFFIAEGSTNSNGIILSNTKKELIDRFAGIGEKAFGFKGNIWVQKQDKWADCYQLQFPSVILKKVFADLFGVGSHSKMIPPEFLGLPENKKIALLKGLFLGDGNIEKSTEGLDKLNYTTVSKHLTYDIWMLLSTIDIVGAIGKIKKKNAFRIRIRGSQLTKLNGIFRKLRTGNRKNRGFFIQDGKVILGISKLKKEEYSGRVFDIQANGNFCAGFLVHNCWIFPKGKETANVGIGIGGTQKETAKFYLDKFIASKPGLAKGSIIEVNAGVIPVGGFLDNMVKDNLMVVGDAAHHVDPVHGGGIGIAMEAGLLCAGIAAEAVKKKDFSEKFLSKYNAIWYETRGNELKKKLRVRHLLEQLSNADFDYLAESISIDDVMLIASADIGKKAKLALLGKKFLKRPGLAKIMLKFMG